jgi:hypothetical protein
MNPKESFVDFIGIPIAPCKNIVAVELNVINVFPNAQPTLLVIWMDSGRWHRGLPAAQRHQ